MNGHNAGYNTGCESIGPFVFYWLEGFTAGILGQPDTLKVDSVGTLFYNPSGVATLKNLGVRGNAAGNCNSFVNADPNQSQYGDQDGNFDGTVRLYAYDYYKPSFSSYKWWRRKYVIYYYGARFYNC